MTKNRLILYTVIMVLILSLTLPVSAAEKKKEHKNFYGKFMVGYRGVETEGWTQKYKEDYNLESGARLFNFYIHYTPDGKLKKYFDSMHVSLRNFGGDPFETFDLSIVKYGVYKFKYDRRKSTYFYQDLFGGQDLHHFDFERVMDSASLKVWLCNYASFYFDFHRYTKKGNSTTSLDISRDEFEFDKPIDESSKEIKFGVDFKLKGLTMLFTETIRDYKNDYNFFLPGANMGEEPGDLAMLNYFSLNQPYDFRSYTHAGRLTARPFENLLIKASASISSQDMRLSYSETASGVTYLGNDFGYSHSGDGEFERKVQMYDVNLTYLISDQFALMGGVRYNNFEQEGFLNIYDITQDGTLDYNTLGLEGGLQYQPSGKIGLSLGVRSEKREVTDHHGTEETKRTGVFGNIKYNVTKKFKLTGDYQFGSFDNPYTDISPTDFHRARFTARYKGKNYYFTGSYLYQLTENDLNELWKSERSQINARAGYYNKKVKLSFGYGMVYSKLEGDRNFVFYGSPTTRNLLYDGRADLFDFYVHLFASKKWTVGGYANYYKNHGYYEIERLTIKPFVEVKFHGGFLSQLAYRYIDFKDNMNGYNYSANIFEISFGYRW